MMKTSVTGGNDMVLMMMMVVMVKGVKGAVGKRVAGKRGASHDDDDDDDDDDCAKLVALHLLCDPDIHN